MKLIIAHLPSTSAFEPLRRELNELGVLRVMSSQVHSSHPQSAIQLRYRGASLDTQLRAQLRIECVVADGQAPAVIGVLCQHAGQAGQVAVIGLEDVYPECSPEPLNFADAWVDAAVH